MKKLITAMLALSALLPLSAQQLPNNGFEEGWVDCVPWTSTGNTTTKQGSTPKHWIVSNTIGTKLGTMFVGKTSVAENVKGFNDSSSAVKVINKSILTKVIPGYFSLGTAWSTASSAAGDNSDGGTFGGYEFTYRPDAVSFFYQASGSAASVVAYAWNGTFKQAEVPGNIVTSGNPTVVTMEDRDRNILDMTTAQGGEVTQKGTLIASKTEYPAIAENWTEFTMELNYVNSETPEKFNVIFSAGDYFNSAPVKDHSMTVDDVKLLYYSRLKSLSIDGTEVPLNDGQYEYTTDIYTPDNTDGVEYTLVGQAPKNVSLDLDKENNRLTVTVKHVDNQPDIDGKSEHVYTINLKKKPRVFTGVKYEGQITELTIDFGDGPGSLSDPFPANVYLTKKGTVLKVDVLLPDLEIPDLGGVLGDILVEDVVRKYTVRDGKKYYAYTGHVDELLLLNGEIHAEVDLTGESDEEGNITFDINVAWFPVEEAALNSIKKERNKENDIPIHVVFNGKTNEVETPTGINDVVVDGDDSDAPVEYFNLQGIRVARPEAGQTVIRRQGSKVTKVIVK